MTKIRLTEGEIITLLEEIILLEAMSLDDIHTKYYNDIDREEFNSIVAADPTSTPQKKGKYTEWLLNLYKNGKLKNEDLYKATDYLEAFHKFKNKIKERDIRKYNSLAELYKTVKQFIDDPEQATSKSDEKRKIKDRGAEKVYEDNTWLVIVPHTKEAAIYYGKGTQWCTAATSSHNYFGSYNKHGNLYININKQNGQKYQFHFESKQFMDEHDDDLRQPVAKTIGLTKGLIDFYKKKYGKLSLPVTSKFDMANVESIIGLYDAFIYYPQIEDAFEQCIIKYNDNIKDYDIFVTLQAPGYTFNRLCLNNRFMSVAKDGNYDYTHNLYDLFNNKLVFEPSDNVEMIKTKAFYAEDADVSNVKYVICEMATTTHDESDNNWNESIFSLEDMTFKYTTTEDDVDIRHMFQFDPHYDKRLFYCRKRNDRTKGAVIDANNGKICDYCYVDVIRADFDRSAFFGIYEIFYFMILSTSRFYGEGERKVLLYDGRLVDYKDFKENEQKILRELISHPLGSK